ncbi:unnamed protein product, partial [Ectocarpus sp. 6 AP-2014]
GGRDGSSFSGGVSNVRSPFAALPEQYGSLQCETLTQCHVSEYQRCEEGRVIRSGSVIDILEPRSLKPRPVIQRVNDTRCNDGLRLVILCNTIILHTTTDRSFDRVHRTQNFQLRLQGGSHDRSLLPLFLEFDGSTVPVEASVVLTACGIHDHHSTVHVVQLHAFYMLFLSAILLAKNARYLLVFWWLLSSRRAFVMPLFLLAPHLRTCPPKVPHDTHVADMSCSGRRFE